MSLSPLTQSRGSIGNVKSNVCCDYEPFDRRCPRPDGIDPKIQGGKDLLSRYYVAYQNNSIALLGHALKHFPNFGISCEDIDSGNPDRNVTLKMFTDAIESLLVSIKKCTTTRDNPITITLDMPVTPITSIKGINVGNITLGSGEFDNSSNYYDIGFYDSNGGMRSIGGDDMTMPSFVILFKKFSVGVNSVYVVYTIYPILVTPGYPLGNVFHGTKGYNPIRVNPNPILSRSHSNKYPEASHGLLALQFTQEMKTLTPRDFNIIQEDLGRVPINIDFSDTTITTLLWGPKTAELDDNSSGRKKSLTTMIRDINENPDNIIRSLEQPVIIDTGGSFYLATCEAHKSDNENILFCIYKCLNYETYKTNSVFINEDISFLQTQFDDPLFSRIKVFDCKKAIINMFDKIGENYIYLVTSVNLLLINSAKLNEETIQTSSLKNSQFKKWLRLTKKKSDILKQEAKKIKTEEVKVKIAERKEFARHQEARLQKEAAQQEFARQEAARQEAARQEAERQEAERQEAERQEAERQEAERLQQEAAQQEFARQEEARQEAERLQRLQQEAASMEIVGVNPPQISKKRDRSARSNGSNNSARSNGSNKSARSNGSNKSARSNGSNNSARKLAKLTTRSPLTKRRGGYKKTKKMYRIRKTKYRKKSKGKSRK